MQVPHLSVSTASVLEPPHNHTFSQTARSQRVVNIMPVLNALSTSLINKTSFSSVLRIWYRLYRSIMICILIKFSCILNQPTKLGSDTETARFSPVLSRPHRQYMRRKRDTEHIILEAGNISPDTCLREYKLSPRRHCGFG